MRVTCIDDTWPLDVAQAILEPVGARVEFAREIAGDDVVGVLTYPGGAVGVDVLDRAPNLRVVATCSTGYDHLDADGLAQRGVWCCRVTHFCDVEVADHTMALIYAVLRGVVMLDRLVRAGTWWPYPERQAPRPVTGSLLAVVGFGTIGRMVVERAVAAGMRVVVVSEHATAGEVEAVGARLAPLDEALVDADVVALLTSVSDRTRGLIDASALARMRPDAYLVNTARAALVDHAALGAALESGAIAGAAIDCLPVEPAPPDEPAFDWPDTILQPHAAWYSATSELRSFTEPTDDVARVLAGQRPQRPLVDLDVG
jgi:D-3-phosphoglycerate dehydrogenase